MELAIMVLLFLAVLIASYGVNVTHAATTLTSSVTNANGELTTTLTWDSTLSSCMSSGHPAWDGPKESSGTMQLPTITLSGTYTLEITCSDPADDSAALYWANPTQNTDGTAYTNHAGTRIHYGRSPSELSETLDLMNPGLMAYVFDDLPPGEWFFAVRAVNDKGAVSALSNVASKTLRAGSTESESVTLTVNPVPAAGVLERVE